MKSIPFFTIVLSRPGSVVLNTPLQYRSVFSYLKEDLNLVPNFVNILDQILFFSLDIPVIPVVRFIVQYSFGLNSAAVWLVRIHRHSPVRILLFVVGVVRFPYPFISTTRRRVVHFLQAHNIIFLTNHPSLISPLISTHIHI